MASHNLSHIQIDQLEIIGYSVAGEETVVAVPQLDVCFDIGKAPDQLIAVDNLLLTHGHMDHAAGIAYYLSHRKFCGLKPGRIFLPKNLVEPVEQIIDAWGNLDGSRLQCEMVPVTPGQEYQIKPDHYVRTFEVKHSWGAVGYSIIEKRKKLKEQFHSCTTKQIVELKKKGTVIDYTMELPIVSYLGDTSILNFHENPDIAKSKILIAECTFFLDEHCDRATAGKHTHVDDFIEMIDKMDNQHIIITHLSQRMGLGEAKRILRKKLSHENFAKVKFLMDRRFLQKR